MQYSAGHYYVQHQDYINHQVLRRRVECYTTCMRKILINMNSSVYSVNTSMMFVTDVQSMKFLCIIHIM